MNSVIVPALQMGKLRHQEVKQPSQGPYTGCKKVSRSVLPDPKVFHVPVFRRSLNLQTQKEMGRDCHGEATEPEDHHWGQELAWPRRGTLTIPITRQLCARACLVFLLRKKVCGWHKTLGKDKCLSPIKRVGGCPQGALPSLELHLLTLLL